jgi:hypothetical protein
MPGHKRIESTMKYLRIITIKDNEFETATVTTDEEIRKPGALDSKSMISARSEKRVSAITEDLKDFPRMVPKRQTNVQPIMINLK